MCFLTHNSSVSLSLPLQLLNDANASSRGTHAPAEQVECVLPWVRRSQMLLLYKSRSVPPVRRLQGSQGSTPPNEAFSRSSGIRASAKNATPKAPYPPI